MGFMKKDKVPLPPPAPKPVLQIQAAVYKEAILQLGQKDATIDVKLLVPGLSAQAVNALVNAADNEGYVTLQLMPRSDEKPGPQQ